MAEGHDFRDELQKMRDEAQERRSQEQVQRQSDAAAIESFRKEFASQTIRFLEQIVEPALYDLAKVEHERESEACGREVAKFVSEGFPESMAFVQFVAFCSLPDSSPDSSGQSDPPRIKVSIEPQSHKERSIRLSCCLRIDRADSIPVYDQRHPISNLSDDTSIAREIKKAIKDSYGQYLET